VKVIGVDDGSSDESFLKFADTIKKINGIPYTVVRQSNSGTGAARNAALEGFTEGWVFFLDADDELAFDPVPFLKAWPDASSLGFDVKFQKNGKPRGRLRTVLIDRGNHLDIFTARNACTASSLIFKRSAVQSLFDTKIPYLEDWLFWIANPLVFESMIVFPRQTSALIHAHDRNKTRDSALNGFYRELISQKIRETLKDRLTVKQNNNLRIQARIGLLQQGRKMAVEKMFLFPCSPALYGRFILYFLFQKKIGKLGLYGNKPRSGRRCI
jgi:glycosyltransferase involved in cell wall biosynthesis